LLRCELPIDFRLKIVAISLSGRYRRFDFYQAPDAAGQTLANHHIQFNLSHVKPTAVLRHVDKSKRLRTRLASSAVKASYNEPAL